MCIIVDTNTFHKFREADEDMEPVWTWLEKRGGKVAYSDIEKLEEEWNRGGMQHLRNRLKQTGKLRGKVYTRETHVHMLTKDTCP